MEVFNEIANFFAPLLKNIWVQIALLVVFATAHGYAGAWLAVRMLFRPRMPFTSLAASSVAYRFARTTASLIATSGGTVPSPSS